MPLLTDDLDLETYVRTLQRLYSLVVSWELFAEATAPSRVRPFVRARARRLLLEADLGTLLGFVPRVSDVRMPDLRTEAEFLGALYVVEGSRLGGQLLARHICRVLRLESGQGATYFQGFGEQTGTKWKELIGLLETCVLDVEADLAVAGAKAMFRTYGDWMASTENVGGAGVAGRRPVADE